MAQNKQNNVVVVGGSSGIGLATARLALRQLPGTNVIISSSNKDKLTKAVEELKSDVPPGDHIIDFVVGDISRFESQFDDVEAILKASTERFGGKIDHIVWTAGQPPTPPQDSKPSHKTALRSATTKVFGPATLFQLAKTYMTDTKHSSITITSGVAIYKPMAALAPYAAGASSEPLSRGLAVMLAPIRSNFVVLGAVQTPLLERFATNEEKLEWFRSRTLTKNVGLAEEAAEAYLYSMRCAFVTGTRIDCDGGALLVW